MAYSNRTSLKNARCSYLPPLSCEWKALLCSPACLLFIWYSIRLLTLYRTVYRTHSTVRTYCRSSDAYAHVYVRVERSERTYVRTFEVIGKYHFIAEHDQYGHLCVSSHCRAWSIWASLRRVAAEHDRYGYLFIAALQSIGLYDLFPVQLTSPYDLFPVRWNVSSNH